jgi:hypothetical protein
MGIAVIQLVNCYWNQVLSSVPSVVTEFIYIYICYELHSLSR